MAGGAGLRTTVPRNGSEPSLHGVALWAASFFAGDPKAKASLGPRRFSPASCPLPQGEPSGLLDGIFLFRRAPKNSAGKKVWEFRPGRRAGTGPFLRGAASAFFKDGRPHPFCSRKARQGRGIQKSSAPEEETGRCNGRRRIGFCKEEDVMTFAVERADSARHL